MIDFLILKYRELKNPQRDPVVFKKFIFFKQDVITQTAQLISQLEEFQDVPLWLIAQVKLKTQLVVTILLIYSCSNLFINWLFLIFWLTS